MNPKASVIIPVYNGAHVIRACLNSLMNQTVPSDNFEVIVVDDGSTDSTREVVEQYPVRLLSIPRSGPAKARNEGAFLARGGLLAFTDADCVPSEDWLESLLAPFEDSSVVGAKGIYLTDQKEPAARFAQAEFETRYEMLKSQPSIDFVDTYSCAFRRDVFVELGGFDPSFPLPNNEDVEFSYRLAAHLSRPDSVEKKRLVFVSDARVRHTHPASWRDYTRNKFWRGYWRMAVYKRFADKVLSDSYTPQSLKVQIAMLALFLLALPLSLLSLWALACCAAFAGVFAVSSVSFFRSARRTDPALAPFIPLGLLLRAGAIGFGVLLSFFKPPIKTIARKRPDLIIALHMLLDIAVLAASFATASRLWNCWLAAAFEAPLYEPAAAVRNGAYCVLLCFLVLFASRTYSSRRGKPLFDHVKLMFRASIVSLTLLALIWFVLDIQSINRGLVILFIAIGAVLLSIEKLALYSCLRFIRAGGLDAKRVLLVGKRATLLDPVRLLMQASGIGYTVAGVLSIDGSEVGESVLNVPVSGSLSDLEQFLHENAVDEVLFVAPASAVTHLEQYLSICSQMGIEAKLLKNPFDGAPALKESGGLLGLPLVFLDPRERRHRDETIKRGMDIVLASATLVLVFPLMLIAAALIKLTSKGPAVFKQQRMGLNGRVFTMFKFRTMVVDAEMLRYAARQVNIMNGPVFKAPTDPRVTRLGRWLRRSSIDELPQLWNVLKGEMSFVGPRPLPVYEAKEIRGALRRRASMKPGLTGLWQASGRNAVDFADWMKLDLAYVDHWSLWLDVKIIFKTFAVLIKGTGAW